MATTTTRPQNKNLRIGGPGRPKGSVNKTTRDAKMLATEFVENEAYRASLTRRLNNGKAPHMETLLWHYAYGKPKETTSLEFPAGGVLLMSPPAASAKEWAKQFTHAKKETT